MGYVDDRRAWLVGSHNTLGSAAGGGARELENEQLRGSLDGHSAGAKDTGKTLVC